MQRQRAPENIRLRREYKYFDYLMFLAKPTEDQQQAATEDSSSNDHGDAKSDDVSIKADIPLTPPPPPATPPSTTTIRPNKRLRTHVLDSQVTMRSGGDDEEVVVAAAEAKLYEPREAAGDEDKLFLMSLIPGFRKLSDEVKFEAKIEILKVMKKAHQQMSTPKSSNNHTDQGTDAENK